MRDRPIYDAKTSCLFPARVYFGALIVTAFSLPAMGSSILPPGVVSIAAGPPSVSDTSFAVGATVQEAGTVPVAGGSFSYGSVASASFGLVGASASANFTATGGDLSLAAAAFDDVMTVSFAPFTGGEGIMLLSYTLDGTFDTTGAGDAAALVFVSSNHGASLAGLPPCVPDQFYHPFALCGDGPWYAAEYTSSLSGTFVVPFAVQFTYGTPFNLNFALGVYAGAFTVVPSTESGLVVTPVATSDAGSATTDFGDTMILSGITTFDSQGNPTPLATITSGSGTTYTQDGIVTPEPTASLLLASGIVGILILRKRRPPSGKSVEGYQPN